MFSNWKKISEDSYKAGYRTMLKRVFVLPDGREQDFDIKQEGPVACILALTPDNQVILASQFRPGPEVVLHELPGGGIDPGEDPLEGARRELLEETGYAGDLVLAGVSYTSAYSTGSCYSFVATNCKKVAEQQNSESEFVEVKLVSLEDFKTHLRSGQLTDTVTGYRGLDYLQLL